MTALALCKLESVEGRNDWESAKFQIMLCGIVGLLMDLLYWEPATNEESGSEGKQRGHYCRSRRGMIAMLLASSKSRITSQDLMVQSQSNELCSVHNFT